MTKLFTVLFLFLLSCAVSFAQTGTPDSLIVQINGYNKPISLTQTVKHDTLNATSLLVNYNAYQRKHKSDNVDKYAHRAATLFYTGVGIQVVSTVGACVFITRTNRATPLLIGGAGLLTGIVFEIAGITCIQRGRISLNSDGVAFKFSFK
jgi:hypothetical protein